MRPHLRTAPQPMSIGFHAGGSRGGSRFDGQTGINDEIKCREGVTRELGNSEEATGLVAEFELVEAAPFVDGDGNDPTEGEEADDEIAEGSEVGVEAENGGEEAAG